MTDDIASIKAQRAVKALLSGPARMPDYVKSGISTEDRLFIGGQPYLFQASLRLLTAEESNAIDQKAAEAINGLG